ncbi:hypothetical protein Peur_003753 [Populus x canadensis]
MLVTVGTFSSGSSEVSTEFIAFFLALLFPGALVALNHELLEEWQKFTALRVYWAGVCTMLCLLQSCAVCGLVLFLLPSILCPLYIHGESPMVLDVPSTSPLSGYLSPGDAIISLDGKRIHNEQDWMEITALIDEQTLQSSNLSKSFEDNQSACPDDLAEFVAIQCFDPRKSDDVNIEDGLSRRQRRHCLNAKDVVKLNKCGDGRVTEITEGRHYLNQNPLSDLLLAATSFIFGIVFGGTTAPVPLPGSRMHETRKKFISSF